MPDETKKDEEGAPRKPREAKPDRRNRPGKPFHKDAGKTDKPGGPPSGGKSTTGDSRKPGYKPGEGRKPSGPSGKPDREGKRKDNRPDRKPKSSAGIKRVFLDSSGRSVSRPATGKANRTKANKTGTRDAGAQGPAVHRITRTIDTSLKPDAFADDNATTGETIRINRALAMAGFGSRRSAEALVLESRVKVNGVAVLDLSSQVRIETDVITVDGERISFMGFAYYAYYKPRGIVTTMKDEKGRACIGDAIAQSIIKEPVKPVGRLDRRSEGLVVLTNDGALATRLLHPSSGVVKTYRVSIDASLTKEDEEAVLSCVELEDGPGRLMELSLERTTESSVIYQVKIHEGRNRLIRRIMGARGRVVKRLVRTEFAELALSGLAPGEFRRLTKSEVAALKRAAGKNK